jgi:hypothetical protein
MAAAIANMNNDCWRLAHTSEANAATANMNPAAGTRLALTCTIPLDMIPITSRP